MSERKLRNNSEEITEGQQNVYNSAVLNNTKQTPQESRNTNSKIERNPYPVAYAHFKGINAKL